MTSVRLSLARRIAEKTALETTTDDLIEAKLLLREVLAKLDAAERVVGAARKKAEPTDDEDECQCRIHREGRDLNSALRAYDAMEKP